MLKEVSGQTHGFEEMTLKKKKKTEPTKSQLNVQAQTTILSGKK